MKRFLATIALLAATGFALAAPLPPESVLRPAEAYTDQAGKTFHLEDRRGHVQVVSMFYTSCTFTCPLMIDSGLGIQHALAPSERDALRLLVVSFDPQRDTAAVLGALAAKRKLDPARWTLARTDEAGARKLAALLGIRYRRMASGDFSHSTELVLLDADGRILAKTDQIGTLPDPAFLAEVKKALGHGH